MNGVVKLTDGEEKALDILKKNPNATIKMISLSVRTIQRILVSPKEKDLLIRGVLIKLVIGKFLITNKHSLCSTLQHDLSITNIA